MRLQHEPATDPLRISVKKLVSNSEPQSSIRGKKNGGDDKAGMKKRMSDEDKADKAGEGAKGGGGRQGSVGGGKGVKGGRTGSAGAPAEPAKAGPRIRDVRTPLPA